MREYEIVKETFNPCAGEQRPDTCESLELELEDPTTYVKGLYQLEPTVDYLTMEQEDGSLIIEVLFASGRKHRYTFSAL